MQAAKKAVESIKESAANLGASAKSGLDKSKATVQEKTEKMSAHDPIRKEMATEKKEERIQQAERGKQEAREHNAAAKQSATAGHVDQARYTTTGPGSGPAAYSTTTGDGQPIGASQMSAMPAGHGHGLEPGQLYGHGHGHGGELNEGLVGSNPSGTDAAHDAHLVGTGNTPGTGPAFNLK